MVQTCRLLVFAKTPQPGKVKTRLIPLLGTDGAFRVHQTLMSRTLLTSSELTECRRELWLAGEPERLPEHLVKQASGFGVFRQQGADLGARMAAALAADKGTAAILIGIDCPAMDSAYLRRALERLNGPVDVVIGPAVDGGYVLLASKRADLPIFDAMPWGTSSVLEQTRQRLSQARIAFAELEPLSDLDRPEDWLSLALPLRESLLSEAW